MDVFFEILIWAVCIAVFILIIALAATMVEDMIDTLRGKNKPIDLPDFLKRIFGR